jgi:hypothetical protein
MAMQALAFLVFTTSLTDVMCNSAENKSTCSEPGATAGCPDSNIATGMKKGKTNMLLQSQSESNVRQSIRAHGRTTSNRTSYNWYTIVNSDSGRCLHCAKAAGVSIGDCDMRTCDATFSTGQQKFDIYETTEPAALASGDYACYIQSNYANSKSRLKMRGNLKMAMAIDTPCLRIDPATNARRRHRRRVHAKIIECSDDDPMLAYADGNAIRSKSNSPSNANWQFYGEGVTLIDISDDPWSCYSTDQTYS